MKIYLLTHERELKKGTNTGRVVKECLSGTVEIIVWRRAEPYSELVELIDRNEIALLYNGVDEGPAGSLDDFDNFLILDATWQEAKKMYNMSSYLQRASRVSLKTNEPSSYKLRRNQTTDGLCTAECAIEVLRFKEQRSLSERLRTEFEKFNSK